MGCMECLEKVGVVSEGKGRWVVEWKRLVMLIIGMPLVIGIILILVALLRTAIISHDGILVPARLSLEDADMIGREGMMERAIRMGHALKIHSVSIDRTNQDYEALLEMHDFLEQSFPLIHSSPFITRESINNYSLLYTVEGSVKGRLPYLLASHLDVVPASPLSWEVPPFSGQVVNDSYIYGRGAIDDKVGVMGIMEALEFILQSGRRPRRSLYVAFGHDEEVGGRAGAHGIAEVLASRGVTLVDFILDEGFPMNIGMLSQTDRQVAMIGVSEKGSANIQLSVKGTPGHSSFPPKESSIGILSAAVAKLEANPHPATLDEAQEDTFEYLVPYMDFSNKFLFTNLWLFKLLVLSDLEEKTYTNAMIRTSTAVTIFNAGIKSNVVPPSAMALINHRVNPSHTVAEAVEHDREVIDDHRVRMDVLQEVEALPVSPYKGESDLPFQMVATSIRQVYTDTVVVPAVLIANTDTKWYVNLTRNIFRFLPILIATPEDSLRYHGNNERISVDHYHKAVNFYYRVFMNADLLLEDTPTDVNRYL